MAEHFYYELADRTRGCHLKLANFSLITEMFLGGTILSSSSIIHNEE